MKEENNYTGAKVLSFLIPLVGLIIYAVNIGKNDNLAKDCGKWSLIGIATGFILCLIINGLNDYYNEPYISSSTVNVTVTPEE